MSIKKTAFVLQGGGALGAYEYGVIKALYEYGIRPEIITGVSIGAYNAAVLAGAMDNDPIKSLERLWCEIFPVGGLMGGIIKLLPWESAKQAVQLVGNPNAYSVNPKLMIPFVPATSIYNTPPLRRSLEEVIDFDRLNSKRAPHVVINATNVKTGQLTHFENKNGGRLTIDHVIASGSVAPGYPAVSIPDQQGQENYYWDGGFCNNTPLAKAIRLLQSSNGVASQKVERQLVVAELFPRQAREIPGNLEQVTDRIVELLCSSKIGLDLKLFERTSSYIELIQRIDKKLPKEDEECDKIRSLPAYQSLLNGHKKIDRRLVVTLQDPESALGIMDFSKAALQRRIDSGYDDTVISLRNSDFPSNIH